jgi:hypothetical protein
MNDEERLIYLTARRKQRAEPVHLRLNVERFITRRHMQAVMREHRAFMASPEWQEFQAATALDDRFNDEILYIEYLVKFRDRVGG